LEFRRIVQANGLVLTGEQFTLLEKYVGLLLDWNGKINLISRRDQENVWLAHVLHSVSPWFFVELGTSLRVLDLGTGGGLPGIPLAILRPDLNITLLDSILKKVDAVRHMVAELNLVNVSVVAGRAEEIGRQEGHRHSYDVVVARAVARLSELAKWSRLWLRGDGGAGGRGDAMLSGRDGGGRLAVGVGRGSSGRIRILGPCLLTLKGGDLEGEVREARIKGARVWMVPLVFPGSEQIGLEEKKLLVVTTR
jgi:16S rRNA (guanine(527)-N(7))-methyltransferase RsmG